MKDERPDISEDRLRKARDESRKDRGNGRLADTGLRLEDFYAYMPQHRYIFAPTRELWPVASVNARIPPVDVGAEDPIKASAWLDQHQPVEQMTWYPGEPMLIRDRLIAEGGLIARSGLDSLQPLPTAHTASRRSGRGRSLARSCAPRSIPTTRITSFRWLAHRVQRPAEKINHALLLGGAPGIGKDTLLHPVSYAVGSWNFTEVTPVQLLGRFNGFIKSVVLRINEARDLGEINRYAFYEHCKPLTAAPPEVLRCDEKNIREYSVPTSPASSSLELPDRRLLPAARRPPSLCRLVAASRGFAHARIFREALSLVREGGQPPRRRLARRRRPFRFQPESTAEENRSVLEHRRCQPGRRGRRLRRCH